MYIESISEFIRKKDGFNGEIFIMVTIRKPKQNRSKNTYNSILGAGFISVKKFGIDDVSVLKVCEIAGVGSGSFYEYFKNNIYKFIANSLLILSIIFSISNLSSCIDFISLTLL